MAAVRVRACSGPSREKELVGLGWRRLVALCPGERAVAAPGGAKFQGWRPGCGGVGSRCEAARCLGDGGLAEQSPRAPALSCRPRRLRHSAAATKRWCFQHDGAKAEDGPRAGRTARGKGSGSIGWARPGQRSPPEVRAGRAQRGRLAIFCAAVGGPGPGLREGSSGAGPRGARGRVQQVGVPGTWLWGPVGGGISGAQEGERGGCARPQPSQGWLRGPTPIHFAEAFLGVKTSRPRKDSSERDLASLNFFKMLFGGWRCNKTRPCDLPVRRFKLLLES